MTKVYFANVTPLLDDGVFGAALKRVSLKRQEKINRLKKRHDKNLSLGAGLVIDCALRDFTGESSPYDIDYSKSGKPGAKGNDDVHISISHSGDIALCAVSDFSVGADVQLCTEFKEDVCRRYFGKNESDYILGADTFCEKTQRFFRIWSLKEAYVKMTGSGIGGFKDFELNLNGDVTVTQKDGRLCARFFEFDIPGYASAICVESADDVLEIKNVNILDLLIN